jgi:beta-glucosidase
MTTKEIRCLLALLLLALTPARAQSPVADSAEVQSRVDSIIGKMTVEEKIDLLGGVNFFDVRDIPRLGWPLLGTADGPPGVRNDGPATVNAGVSP